MKSTPRLWFAAAAVACLAGLYLSGLSWSGLLSADEPRYAAIARAMAETGDWITPRLWGNPWFEKPPLLYWLAATGFELGLGPELAPRLPVALLSLGFLLFCFFETRRLFGERAAAFSAAILATSAGWIGFSYVAVTDLPLAACFSAFLLLAAEWVETGRKDRLSWAFACLGLAMLAKGLVPLALSLPVFWFGRSRLGDLLRPSVVGSFAVVALPWYLLCYARNQWPFFHEFILVHHLRRFSTDSLQHVQPWWFYLPVLAVALVPWTPLVWLAARRGWPSRSSERLLWATVLFGLIFFSAATNKLPGYLLPLLPACAVGLGVALDRSVRAVIPFAASAAALAIAIPLAMLLPDALADGLSRAGQPPWGGGAALAVAAAGLCGWLESRGRRLAAFSAIAGGTLIAVGMLKITLLPRLDQSVSARPLATQVAPIANRVCIEHWVNRSIRYGIEYYIAQPLPLCEDEPRLWRITRYPHGDPVLAEAGPEPSTTQTGEDAAPAVPKYYK